MKIFVANLPFRLTEPEVTELFAPYGVVHHCHLVTDTIGQSRGFGFIGMRRREALAAVAALDGTLIEGRGIHVQVAGNQQPRDAEQGS